MVFGPIRVIALEPSLGRTIAVLCETPFLLATMVIAARLAPRLSKMTGRWLSYVTVGLLALAFQQVADLAVGFGLRGMTLNEQLSYFNTVPGYIYLANLAVFTVAPLVVYLRNSTAARAQSRRA